MKTTPTQQLAFQLYLIDALGFHETVTLSVGNITRKNWLGMYETIEQLEKPEGPLVKVEPLIPADIIHNVRLALNELVLERMAKDVNDLSGTPLPEGQAPTEFVSDEEDDGLQPA